MMAGPAGSLRTLAFGDLDAGHWGVAAVGDGLAAASFADSFELEAPTDEGAWLLSAAGVELRLSPTSDQASFGPQAAGISGFAQLCDVQGAIHLDGTEHEIACLGVRASLALPSRHGSARAAAGWFGPEDGFALLALRPSRASGHDGDASACAFVDSGHPLAIDEPRLSTTYAPSGVPLRAGLELWPVEPEQDDRNEDEQRPVHARRIGGEHVGDASRVTIAGLDVRIELFRWRSKGHEGAGVYVLAPAP
jgi:hypothetical protein